MRSNLLAEDFIEDRPSDETCVIHAIIQSPLLVDENTNFSLKYVYGGFHIEPLKLGKLPSFK